MGSTGSPVTRWRNSDMARIERVKADDTLRQCWREVFVSNNPFSYPFGEDVEACVAMYPTSGYALGEEQYDAVVRAAQTVGGTTFYLSVVERAGDFLDHDEHWLCTLPSYQAYNSLPVVIENALYSTEGGWGILLSHEQHAVVGGSQTFVDSVKEAYPRWRSDIYELVQTWKDNPNRGWLGNLLPHLDGNSCSGIPGGRMPQLQEGIDEKGENDAADAR